MWMNLSTCFHTSPVDVFEEGLNPELIATIVFKPEALFWLLFQQSFTKIFALLAELWCIFRCIVDDSACHLLMLNLKKEAISYFTKNHH